MATNATNLDTATRATLAAYFPTHASAEMAVSELKEAGFMASQIGYAGRSGLGGNSTTADATDYANTARHDHKTGEGTWSKIKNFFEGGDVEPYADEKDRGSAQARELVPESPATSDYDTEDLHGSFSDLSIPDQHSKYFGHRLSQGEQGAVVTVNAGSRTAEAEEILIDNGGDLGAASSEYNYSDPSRVEGVQRIQLLGEVLRVHTDRISRGEVRLRKEVVTEQQTVQVPVSHEELVLERVSGDGLTPVAGTVGEGSEIRIPLSEERAHVEKQTVVREEYTVGKRAVEGVTSVNSDVMHEELAVDEVAADDAGSIDRNKS